MNSDITFLIEACQQRILMLQENSFEKDKDLLEQLILEKNTLVMIEGLGDLELDDVKAANELLASNISNFFKKYKLASAPLTKQSGIKKALSAVSKVFKGKSSEHVNALATNLSIYKDLNKLSNELESLRPSGDLGDNQEYRKALSKVTPALGNQIAKLVVGNDNMMYNFANDLKRLTAGLTDKISPAVLRASSGANKKQIYAKDDSGEQIGNKPTDVAVGPQGLSRGKLQQTKYEKDFFGDTKDVGSLEDTKPLPPEQEPTATDSVLGTFARGVKEPEAPPGGLFGGLGTKVDYNPLGSAGEEKPKRANRKRVIGKIANELGVKPKLVNKIYNNLKDSGLLRRLSGQNKDVVLNIINKLATPEVETANLEEFKFIANKVILEETNKKATLSETVDRWKTLAGI